MKTGAPLIKDIKSEQAQSKVTEKDDIELLALFQNLQMTQKKLAGGKKASLLESFYDVMSHNVPNATIGLDLIKRFVNNHNENNIPTPPLKYAAFQGGGAKGTAYVGALEALDQNGYLEGLDTVAGASAGAITAFLVGLGFDSQQFRSIQEKTNFLDFTDLKVNGWGELLNGHKIGTGLDVLRYGSAYDGKSFHDWASFLVEELLQDKNATFRDLHELRKKDISLKDMIFKGTRYNASNGEYAEQTFSFEETPDVCIADALRASMAFPVAFKPWDVRQKAYYEEAGIVKYRFESFGIFADGGILNNYPIDVFNSQQYFDPKYSAIERKDHLGKPVAINPCAVGFSLTTFENLDDSITPLSERLAQKLKEENLAKQEKVAVPSQGTWGYKDLFNAFWWKKVGKNDLVKTKVKHELYFDHTVQIWPEDVNTLEFDASPAKLNNLINNGHSATLLWLQKFRNDKQTYPSQYDDRLSKEELKLKATNPEKFYVSKVTECFIAFMSEMQRQHKCYGSEDKEILANMQLQYLAGQINSLLIESNLSDKSTEEIFTASCKQFQQKMQTQEKGRISRQKLVDSSGLIEMITEKLKTSPEQAYTILSGQLSNVIKLVQLEHKGSNLMGQIVQTNDPIFVKKVFKLLLNQLKQCHFQGRITNPLDEFYNILNQANPSLFTFAVNNAQMLTVLLEGGFTPLQVNKHSGLNAIQETVCQNNFKAFKTLIEFCKNNKIKIKDQHGVTINYIFKNAMPSFISELFADKQLLQSLTSEAFVSSCGNDMFEFCANAMFRARKEDGADSQEMIEKVKLLLNKPRSDDSYSIAQSKPANLHFMYRQANPSVVLKTNQLENVNLKHKRSKMFGM